MSQHGEAHETGHGGHGSVEKKVAGMVKGVNYRSWIVKMGWFWIAVVVTAALGWLSWSPLLYAKKTQPVTFNHLIHVEAQGANMPCDRCHSFDDSGRFSGVPNAEKCLECHSTPINPDNPREMAFIDEYIDDEGEIVKPIEWYVYSKQPDCVYFSHIAHVAEDKGNFSCEECHGNIGRNTTPPPYYENRITRYSKLVYEQMKMGDCADCHRKHSDESAHKDHHIHGNNACFVCHK